MQKHDLFRNTKLLQIRDVEQKRAKNRETPPIGDHRIFKMCFEVFAAQPAKSGVHGGEKIFFHKKGGNRFKQYFCVCFVLKHLVCCRLFGMKNNVEKKDQMEGNPPPKKPSSLMFVTKTMHQAKKRKNKSC